MRIDEDRLPGAWVLEIFQRGGVDLEQLVKQQADEVDEALYRPDIISPDSVNKLLNACAVISGDQSFGLTMNKLVDITMYGLFGYILLQTSTVREFLENLEYYYPIFYQSAFFKISTQKDTVSICYDTDHSPTVCSRHDNEWSIGFVVDHLKSHLGDVAKPLSISFTHQAPDDLGELESLLGPKLLFNQSANQIVYPKAILRQALSDSNPWMLKILRQQADKILREYQRKNTLENEVRMLLLENIELTEQGKSSSKASDIASKLNLSLSSFKRNLTQEKTKFSEIKESVINQLAKEMLSDTEASMSDITKKLGFVEQSSFTRFFIRCNTMTPQEFRKKHST